MNLTKMGTRYISIMEIFSHYGPRRQLCKAIEELSELQIAIADELAGEGSAYNLVEEIADVKIMLAQLELILEPESIRVDDVIDFKLERELDRIAKARAEAVDKEAKIELEPDDIPITEGIDVAELEIMEGETNE